MSDLNSKDIKHYNRKQVLKVLRQQDEISVKEITRITGISRTSVARSVQKFLKEGLLIENGKGSSTIEGGKRPILYSLDKHFKIFALCHILPNSLHSLIFDLCGNILQKCREEITSNLSLGNFVTQITTDFKNLLNNLNIDIKDLAGIAIDIPGISNINTGEFILAPHCPELGRNINLGSLINQKLGINIPCYIDNHLRFQCYAEKKLGMGNNYNNFITLEADDGLGAAIIIDGKTRYGNDCIAGEIGHMLIDPEDTFQCSCGGYGCLENKVSATAVARLYHKMSKKYKTSQKVSINENTGKINFNELFKAADSQDQLACAVVTETARWFAYGISNLILTINPELIIFQGAYAKGTGFFNTQLTRNLHTRILENINIFPKVAYSTLSDESYIAGAAILLSDLFFDTYK